MTRFRGIVRVASIAVVCSFVLTLMVSTHLKRTRKEVFTMTVTDKAVRDILALPVENEDNHNGAVNNNTHILETRQETAKEIKQESRDPEVQPGIGLNDPSLLPHWKDQYWCNIDCKTGVPCEYKDEVDLRVILIVANRPESLQKSFTKAAELDMMDDRLSIDIWIDMSKDGVTHEGTLKMAKSLVANFSKGRACYHLQDHHAFIATQWIDTYRPKKDTKEVGIILEDDIDLSKYAWRWYKAVHEHFRNADDYIAGYSLKSENKKIRSTIGNMQSKPIAGPKTDTIVLYHCFQAWGYSPQPNVWRDFQDWYHAIRKDKGPDDKVNKIDSIEPKIYGSLHTSWWYSFKKKNYQESMAHEMFNIYYTHKVSKRPLYTVYQNLDVFTGKDIRLCSNRKEKGLHYGGTDNINTTSVLLNYWDESFVKFPAHPKRMTIRGENVDY